MSVTIEESRRLTGANLYFDGTGAALEAVGDDIPDALIDTWREAISFASRELGWREGAIAMKRHASGVSLAFEAPADQLNTAVHVNEWALGRALRGQAEPRSLPYELVEASRDEALPQMMKLMRIAEERGIPVHWDDEFLTTGDGVFGRNWPIDNLPDVDDLDAARFKRVPKAVITGSNGKTTVTRTLAHLMSRGGARVGYSSTDGIIVNGERFDEGDYSGPMGLRYVMRHPEVDIAILETARGGLLRRGLATRDADVAIVTNVTVDHFGEYGVHNLADLREVKLLVHKALRPEGVLVTNAGDDALVERVKQLSDTRTAWFALTLDDAMSCGLPACGVADDHLWLVTDDGKFDLGATADMPLSLGGRAHYNLENLAAASLAAHLMGISVEHIAAGVTHFGSDQRDNRGRLQRWTVGGVEVLVDYAHNPDGLSKLLKVADSLRGAEGRIGLLLEQAGNRSDEDIRELARAGAATSPARVWVKDLGGEYQRGRAEGEVIGVLKDALLRDGIAAEKIQLVDGVESLIADAFGWARAGDVLVLPVHIIAEREALIAELESRSQE